MNIFSEVAIAGIGETKVGKIPGITGIQFQVEAARLALEDAGLSKDDVDGVFSFGGYSASMQMHALQVSEYMGMKPDFNAQVDVGGVITPMTAIFNAASAISSGLCNVALCTFGENASSYRPLETHGWHRGAFQGGEEFEDQRILEALGGMIGRPSQEIVARLVAGVRVFAADAGLSDDLTLMVAQRL